MVWGRVGKVFCREKHESMETVGPAVRLIEIIIDGPNAPQAGDPKS